MASVKSVGSDATIQESQHREQLNDLREKQRAEIDSTMTHFIHTKEDLDLAYNVELSREKEGYEQKLSEIREHNAKRLLMKLR